MKRQEFLYRIRPTRPAMLRDGGTAEERVTLEAHFAYLTDLQAQGLLILAGRTQNDGDDSFGLVIFRAADRPEAETIMAGDPAVSGGVMAADLFPYHVALRET